MRILFLSYCPPTPSWGGAMTFFRHFCERPDFKLLVATTDSSVSNYNLPYQPIRFSVPSWFRRISNTRFFPWTYGFQSLYGDRFLPQHILDAAKHFQPDAIFTVAGSWDWTALVAQRVAQQLHIPLIASFNDWFNYGGFPAHPLFHRAIESRFRRFYQNTDLAFCTSDGMRDALGPHHNSHILYPMGAVIPIDHHEQSSDCGHLMNLDHPKINTHRNDDNFDGSDRPFTIFFGGSLGDWYGPMLESLIHYCHEHYPSLRFQIFGSLANWSESFDTWAKKTGIFRGRIPFEQLRQEAAKADLLLLPMGFDAACAQVERTSFKTKFLDYLSFRRPILVWGPDYCSAVRTAQEFDSADCVTVLSPADCAAAIHRLASNPQRRRALLDHAYQMYCDRFHPDTIHTGLVQAIQRTIAYYPFHKFTHD